MAQRVVFQGKQLVDLEDFDLPLVEGNQVSVRGIYSLMSTGTENIVFNRLFAEGAHWDNWVKYPFYPGYGFIGEVRETGGGVDTLKVGDVVAIRVGHASEHVVDAGGCIPVPVGVDPAIASWFALAKIAFMGALAAEYRLGDSVLVIGAGPIGQMSVRWAAAGGAQTIIAVDPAEPRLEAARAGGATHAIARPINETGEEVMAACGGKLPRLVIDGTGNPDVFEAALSLAGYKGKVVVLGDTGFPAQQRLTSDVIMRGITIVGAHDGHSDAQWNDRTIAPLFFHLVKQGRFNMAGLNSHTFKPSEAKQAYEVANTRRGETMGIGFDWKQHGA